MKILIIKPSSFGDIIHTIPLIQDILNNCPNALISWVVNSPFVSFVKEINGVTEVFSFERGSWKKKRFFLKNIVSLIKLIRQIRSRKFDIVLDLQGLFRSGFLAACSGAVLRIGFDNAREGSIFFYHKKVLSSRLKAHALDQNRKMAEHLFPDAVLGEAEFRINIPEETKKQLRQNIRSKGILGPYAVLCPDARWESKKWPESYFLELGKKIIEKLNISVIVAGDESIRMIWDSLLSREGVPIISMAGETTLLELSVLLQEASFAVTNDSGPMHLAVALDTPVVAIMGPTSPDKTGPYRGARVIQKSLDCVPCMKRKCLNPSKDECMNSIIPDDVFEEIVRFVNFT